MKARFLSSPFFVITSSLILSCVAAIDVQVGQNGLTFTPDTVSGPPGTVVNFHFHGSIHTASQAVGKLNNPCTTGGGFDSGVESDGAVYPFTIPSTDSVYVFCTPHCKLGMVMIINPGSSDSVAAYRQAAMGGGTGGGSSTTASSPTTSSSSSGSSSVASAATSSTAPVTVPTSAPVRSSSQSAPPTNTSTTSTVTSHQSSSAAHATTSATGTIPTQSFAGTTGSSSPTTTGSSSRSTSTSTTTGGASIVTLSKERSIFTLWPLLLTYLFF